MIQTTVLGIFRVGGYRTSCKEQQPETTKRRHVRNLSDTTVAQGDPTSPNLCKEQTLSH